MRKHLDFDDFLKESLKSRRIKTEYDRLQPKFALIEAVLKARKEKGLTQEDLAERIGTKQSVISRLEKGRANPTVAFLMRLAQVLQTSLEIRFAPLK